MTYNVTVPGGVFVTFDVPGLGNQVDQLTLGGSSTLNINPGRELEVLDEASISGFVTTDNGSFTANSPASIFPGNAARLAVSGGGQLIVAAPTYTNTVNSSGDLIAATGSGSQINLSLLQSINADADFGGSPIRTIAARNSGTLDLSSLTEIVGAGGGDSLRLEVSSGGMLDLSGLQTISGNRNVRIASDGTALALPSLQTVNAAVLFELATGMSLELPALTNFDGTGSGFNAALNVPNNGTVTAGVLVAVNDVDISLGDFGTLSVPNVGTYTRGTLTLGANQTVSSGPLVNVDGSRFVVSGGASFSVSASSYDTLDFYSSGDFFVATGASTLLDMSSVQSLNFDHDVGGAPIATIAARDSGTLNLSGVTDVVGARGGDSLRLEVSSGGTLDLSGLQAISGNRNVRIASDGTALALPSLQTVNSAVLFELAAGMSLDLPALTNFDGTGSGFDAALNVPDNGTVTAGALVGMDDVDISLGDGGTLSVPNLGTYTRGTLTLGANQAISSGPLVNIDGSRFVLSGGASFSVAATSYDTLDFYSSGDSFVATGTSTVLDMSSVQSLNFDHDVGGAPIATIAARDSGTLDLSRVTDIVGARGGDSLRLEVASGGTLDLSGLQTISGNRNVRITSDGTALALPSLQTVNAAVLFELAAGMSFDLPALTNFDGTGSGFNAALNVPDNGTVTAGVLVAVNDVDISLGDGGTLSVPNVGTYTRGTLTLGANQTVSSGPLVNIDGSRFVISGGASFAVAATSYDTLDFYSSGDFFVATGASTVLDMSSVQSLNFDHDVGGAPIAIIAARDGGALDLSGVTDIVGARGGDSLRLEVASSGTLDLSGLQSISGNRNVRITSDGTALALPGLQTINAAVLFELAAGMSLDLPALTNFDGTGSFFDTAMNVPDNGTVTASVLVSMDDVDLSLGDGGTLSVPNLNTYTRGTLTLGANQAVNSGPLQNIDGSRFVLSGGASYAVAATSYDTLAFYGSGDFFAASGPSTVLDMSSVQSLSFDQDFGGAPVSIIAARNDGHVDLSAVVNIVGPRGGDFLESAR